MVCCDVLCYAGVAPKARSTPPTPHPQPPQNQLHLRKLRLLKICMVGCDVARGVASKSPSRATPE